MGTILSIDTPAELRRLDAKFENPAWRGWLVLRMLFAVAAGLVLLIAAVGGSLFGMLIMLVFFALLAGPIVSLWWRMRAARPYRMRIRHSAAEIREAHEIYRRLAALSSQQYARPLVLTMYRLSALPVDSYEGTWQVHVEILKRLASLRRLHEAEDHLTAAAAGRIVVDQDDLDVSSAYAAALDEVAGLVVDP